jgi:uncharacterized protein (DUF1778 family)
MVAEKRVARLEVRMTETESAMLTRLAEAQGLTRSDIVRLLVRESHASTFGKRKRRKS